MAFLHYGSQVYETSDNELMGVFLITQSQFMGSKGLFVQVWSLTERTMIWLAPSSELRFVFDPNTEITAPEFHELDVEKFKKRGFAELWVGPDPQEGH